MKPTALTLSVLALLLLVGSVPAALPQTSLAQSPQQTYDLSWWTVDGGGDTFSIGGGYSLGGTAGQPDAGSMTGSGYTLGGGFWKGGAVVQPPAYHIYLPLVTRGF